MVGGVLTTRHCFGDDNPCDPVGIPVVFRALNRGAALRGRQGWRSSNWMPQRGPACTGGEIVEECTFNGGEERGGTAVFGDFVSKYEGIRAYNLGGTLGI